MHLTVFQPKKITKSVWLSTDPVGEGLEATAKFSIGGSLSTALHSNADDAPAVPVEPDPIISSESVHYSDFSTF